MNEAIRSLNGLPHLRMASKPIKMKTTVRLDSNDPEGYGGTVESDNLGPSEFMRRRASALLLDEKPDDV